MEEESVGDCWEQRRKVKKEACDSSSNEKAVWRDTATQWPSWEICPICSDIGAAMINNPSYPTGCFTFGNMRKYTRITIPSKLCFRKRELEKRGTRETEAWKNVWSIHLQCAGYLFADSIVLPLFPLHVSNDLSQWWFFPASQGFFKTWFKGIFLLKCIFFPCSLGHVEAELVTLSTLSSSSTPLALQYCTNTTISPWDDPMIE